MPLNNTDGDHKKSEGKEEDATWVRQVHRCQCHVQHMCSMMLANNDDAHQD